MFLKCWWKDLYSTQICSYNREYLVDFVALCKNSLGHTVRRAWLELLTEGDNLFLYLFFLLLQLPLGPLFYPSYIFFKATILLKWKDNKRSYERSVKERQHFVCMEKHQKYQFWRECEQWLAIRRWLLPSNKSYDNDSLWRRLVAFFSAWYIYLFC